MGRFEDGIIVLSKASWEPSLLDLRVGIGSAREISVDLFKNLLSHKRVVFAGLESVVEHYL